MTTIIKPLPLRVFPSHPAQIVRTLSPNQIKDLLAENKRNEQAVKQRLVLAQEKRDQAFRDAIAAESRKIMDENLKANGGPSLKIPLFSSIVRGTLEAIRPFLPNMAEPVPESGF